MWRNFFFLSTFSFQSVAGQFADADDLIESRDLRFDDENRISSLQQVRGAVESKPLGKQSRATVSHSQRHAQEIRKPTITLAQTRDDGDTEGFPEKESISSKINRIFVDAFSGAGVHSIHADPSLNRELAARLSTQDIAVGIMLLVFYFLTVTFGWVVVYRMAINNSGVKYFCDPDEHPQAAGPTPQTMGQPNQNQGPLVATTTVVEDFMKVFAKQPQSVNINIAGFREESLDGPLGATGSLTRWGGKFWSTRFNVNLALKNWCPEEGTLSAKDRGELEHFFHTPNSLARLNLKKQISWPAFEELASRIRKAIKEKGFNGKVEVKLDGDEELNIYQNTTWSNFWHNRTTKILVVLSLVGPIVYYPLMLFRGKTHEVTTEFKLDLSADEYWALIEDRVTAQGFRQARDLDTVIAEHAH